MLKVGLTGGIGCGKSTVCQLFSELGVPVIDADIIAHQLVETGKPALQQIVTQFGNEMINSEGTLNRNLLKDIVFSNPKQRKILEAIMHPLIFQAISEQINVLDHTYCIICIPLLFETQSEHFVDRIVVVNCSLDVQIERVISRDKISEQQVRSIIESQVSNTYRNIHANECIENSNKNSGLAEQVKNLHNLYLSLSV